MIITRFAPSPTGYPALHLGGGRQALFSYLFAKKMGGKFILRIEDTDQKRYKEGAVQDILTGLEWLGLKPDDSPSENELLKLDVDPVLAGKFGGSGNLVQSMIADNRYYNTAMKLVESGDAYIAFSEDDTEDDVNIKKFKKDKNAKENIKSLNLERWRNAPSLLISKALATGRSYTIRIKIPHDFSNVVCLDTVRGNIVVNTSALFDAVLLKSDGTPTYHLASVVDDHYQGVTDVIRNEEWLSTFPIHVMLYKALGWDMPRFTHTSSILNPNGRGKISKRAPQMDGIPVFINEYRHSGFLPGALLNMLALTGWNPGNDREVLSLDDMIELFSLDRINPSGSAWNYRKLIKLNQTYISNLSNQEWLREIKSRLVNQL